MNSTPIGLSKWELDTPVLCLDADKLERNIAHMASFMAAGPVRLRPHCKTHKCPTIAWMQLRAGAIGITCAKLGEAEVMARAGIQDLLIANQIIGAEKIARLVNLAAYSRVMVAVDDAENAAQLSAAAQAKGVRLRAIIEVDTGMGRCGVQPGPACVDLARKMVSLPGLQFEGIMGYEGHAVMIPDMDERLQVTTKALDQLLYARDLLQRDGIAAPIVSAGGTGTYHITGRREGITELQAGSYATMDAKYEEAHADFELALSVVARVISTPTPDLAVIDAGHKTLTIEFGLPRLVKPEGWKIGGFSEEHAKIVRRGGAPLKRGDRVEIVPSHGCTTINLHDAYWVTRKDILEAVWPIAARGHIR